MSGGLVPADDLPDNIVPASDLPSNMQLDSKGRYVVEPNPEQRRMGLRKNRFKDENLAGNVGRGALSFGEDMGREATMLGTGIGLPPGGANALGFAADMASNFIPVLPAGRVAATAAAPLMEAGAKDVMQRAVKPALSKLKSNRAAEGIETMLKEGINATPGGMQKLHGMIDDLNGQILKAVQDSPAVVDKVKAAQTLQETLANVTKQANPQADIGAVKKAWDEFLNHPLLAGKDTMPVQLAQEMKQGTYKALHDKYGQLGSADVEAQKAIARGLKNEIADAVPGVAGLNKHESELLNALSVAENASLRSGNANIGGLAWLAHNPKLWAAFMADRSSLFKSLAARMLYSGKEAIPASAAEGAVGSAMAVNAASPKEGR